MIPARHGCGLWGVEIKKLHNCIYLPFFLHALLPLSASAQEVSFSIAATEDCLAGGGSNECIGAAADACMEATAGGYTTYGMSACIGAELDWWDGALNAAYRDLRTRESAADMELTDVQIGMESPSRAEALRDLQRAWILWRDATCDYEALQWFGGTGAGGARLGCLMGLTGQQTLYLRGTTAAR